MDQIHKPIETNCFQSALGTFLANLGALGGQHSTQ